MMQAWVTGVGLCGPGLDGWAAGREALAGARAWTEADIRVPPAALLAPNERRRAGLPVRLALAVAQEASAAAGLAPDALRGVFGSANGEAAILHELLQTLASEAPRVSPTQFHNSVHNAVAGYWAMGARSCQPMACLGAGPDTFAAAMLKAAAEVAVEREPVLLCVYDAPMPEPLAAKSPTGCAFACALVLSPDACGAMARISVEWAARPAAPGADLPSGPHLAAMSAGNPAARALRLLQSLAARRADWMEHALFDGAVLVAADPC